MEIAAGYNLLMERLVKRFQLVCCQFHPVTKGCMRNVQTQGFQVVLYFTQGDMLHQMFVDNPG